MVVVLEAEHLSMVKTIATKNNFQNYLLQTELASKGDGYSGNIVRVKIKDNEKELNVILKLAYVSSKPNPIYLKEIFMYNTLFVAFDNFQLENGLEDGFNFHTKLYDYCEVPGKEGLAFENLMSSGLKQWKRGEAMDSKHVTLVLKEYAKLHAVSFAMKEKEPDRFKELLEGLGKFHKTEDTYGWMLRMLGGFKDAPKIARGDIEVENGMKRAADIAEKFFNEQYRLEEYKTAIIHGDCWSSNMLFKYDGAEPNKVCLIDWQISSYTTPAIDVSYFIGANASKEILDDYMTYLKIYHDTLSYCLRKVNCNPDDIFPFSKLMEHWKKFAKFMAFMTPIMFKVQMIEADQAADLNKIQLEDMVEQMRKIDNEIADKRAYDVIKFLVDNELL